MTAPRMVIVALLACAVVGDAALGALSPASARPPLLVLAAVAGVALAGGIRVGMVTGFGVGLLLDLLSGPASLAGVHAVTVLTVGVAAAAVARRGAPDRRSSMPPPFAVAMITGATAAAGAALLSVTLHRLVGSDVGGLAGGVVVHALAVGSVVTPVVHRMLQRLAVRPLV